MNILDYLRIAKPTPQNKGKFLVEHYGAKLSNILLIADDPVYKDVLTLLFLSMGSPKDVESFLIEQYELFQSIKDNMGETKKDFDKSKSVI